MSFFKDIKEIPKDIEFLIGKRVVILGAKGAGKTSFLRMLQKNKFDPINDLDTPRLLPYEGFFYKTEYGSFDGRNKGKLIRIWKGNDSPGESGEYQQQWSKSLEQLRKKCLVFFVIDAYGYVNDEKVNYFDSSPRSNSIRETTNSYLDAVIRLNTKNNPICLVFSHIDQFGYGISENKIDRQIRDLMSEKHLQIEDYKSFCVDLTNKVVTLRHFENYIYKIY